MHRKIYITVIFIILLTEGCDLLNQTPKESISSGQIFTSKANVEAVLAGAYSGLQGIIPDQYEAAEIAADGARHSGSLPRWGMIDSHDILPHNLETTNIWDSFYNVI